MTATPHPGLHRLAHLDLLRGLIMLLMALDHASLFVAHVHPSEFWAGPPPHYAGSAAFLTRFASHLCAPGFFFLTGAGMVLFARQRRRSGWSDEAVRKHYLLRGLLLVLLQLLVENPAWSLGSRAGGESSFVYFGVLYGLGAAMIAGAILVRLPPVGLLGLGVVCLVSTQVVVPGWVSPGETLSVATRLLLVPGRTSPIVVLYPVIPWAGVTLLGMAYAHLLAGEGRARRRTVLIGSVSLALFLLLRLFGGFGNTRPVDTSDWIGFFSLTKYPPSLTFVLLTLGLDLLILALFSGSTGKAAGIRLLEVYGRTPLLFYLVHLYLYALMGRYLAPADGTSLAAMYLYWAAGVAVLYPLCRRYGAFKRATAAGSVWRLL